MTKSDATRDAENNPIANMEGLQAAIVDGEAARVKELIADQALDPLQKDYLIELAMLNNNAEVIDVLKKARVRRVRDSGER
ncbi:hypothetical protein LJ739_05000 [Aestuariibacter halophilus]|uniref:Uncharacterized protein n=1 Tax=Fluctibacter halophilus TaxID=226011 RepID=A0ABS8G7F1_9ALTE|nr:hypothetical protein [Aestuariibacter halophilus]MCC2615594.1 hypothetical protein [Aestuariibacter halophilus]